MLTRCFQLHPEYAEYGEIKLDILGDGSFDDATGRIKGERY